MEQLAFDPHNWERHSLCLCYIVGSVNNLLQKIIKIEKKKYTLKYFSITFLTSGAY